MPRIYARGNYAGIDSRSGSDDSSINNCEDCMNIVHTDKTIKPRRGHQKLINKAIPTSGLIWNSFTAAGPMVIKDSGTTQWTTNGDYTLEFAYMLDGLPPAGSTRQLLDGPVGAYVDSAARLYVGWDTGAGVVYADAGPVVGGVGSFPAETVFFVSVRYEAATDTLTAYTDGSLTATVAAYSGGAGFNPQNLDVEVGSVLTGAESRSTLAMCELRFWDTLRTPAEILTWAGKQIPFEKSYNTSIGMIGYWRMDEGAGGKVESFAYDQDAYVYNKNPWVLGLVDDRGAALRVEHNINDVLNGNGSVVGQLQSAWAGAPLATQALNWYTNGFDQTWQFVITMDRLEPEFKFTSDVRIMDLGYEATTQNGMRLGVYSPRAGRIGLFVKHYRAGALNIEVRTQSIDFTQIKDVAVTCDYTAGAPNTRQIAIWIDGAKVAESAVTNDAGANTTANNLYVYPVYLQPPLPNIVPDGWSYTIDTLKLYQAVRTSEQISYMVKRSSLPDQTAGIGNVGDTQLAADWGFDEGSMQTDKSVWVPISFTGGGFWSHVSGAGFGPCGTGSSQNSDMTLIYRHAGGWGPGLVSPFDGDVRGQEQVGDKLIVASRSGLYSVDEDTDAVLPLLPHAGSMPYLASMTQVDDKVYCYGSDRGPGYYTQGQYFMLGVRRPTMYAAGTDQGVVGGSLWQAGDYKLGYTFYSSVTGVESDYSPLSDFTIAANNSDLLIECYPLPAPLNTNRSVGYCDDAEIDTVIFYATRPNGTTLFEVTRVAYSTSISVTLTSPGDQLSAVPSGHQQPNDVRFGVLRDGRMITGGATDNERGFYWSAVNAPEYQDPIDFRSLSQPVIGIANTDDNLLMVFGTDRRGIIRGDITNALEPFDEFLNGGCSSHQSLENIGGWVFGIGLDGPFKADDKSYYPIDEIVAGGRVVGSIRKLLEARTDKAEWRFSSSAYDFDKKLWYLCVPDSGAQDSCIPLVLHVDIMAWTRFFGTYRSWCPLSRRVVSGGSEVQVIGEIIPGFPCILNSDDIMLDGRSNSTFEFTVSAVDTSERKLTLNATPDLLGDGCHGCRVRKWNVDDRHFQTNLGVVYCQDGADIYVEGSVGAINVGDTVRIGAYQTEYRTKMIDGRTSVANSKIWDYLNVDGKQQGSTAYFYLSVGGLDDGSGTFFATPAEFLYDMSESRDWRIPIGYASERFQMQFGSLDPVEWEVYNFVIDYRQQRNSHL